MRMNLRTVLILLSLLLPVLSSTAAPLLTRSVQAPPHAAGAGERSARPQPPAPPARLTLPTESAERLQAEMRAQSGAPGAPVKIGYSRTLPGLQTEAETAALLGWQDTPHGQVASLSIRSPAAFGVRLGLLPVKVPDATVFRFYAQGEQTAFTVSGHEIMDAVVRNLGSGARDIEARTWWSPVIEGEEITIEITLPPGTPSDALRFSIPRLAHQFSSAIDTTTLMEKVGQSASCHLDATCYVSTWGNESKATAKMSFMSGGYSYVCSGTLLNDTANSRTPYFLSANHCISAQTEATTLHTYWFYQSSACNNGTLSPTTQTLAGGATLLYASPLTDTSFMQLNAAAPAGAWFSGWSPSLQALGTGITGIHHPAGDLQKISFGTISQYYSCDTTTTGSYTCYNATSSTGKYLNVTWSQGITEGGSSGSGLWVNAGGNHYLVGQLRGGSSTCAAPATGEQYGRFDLAYTAALSQWLAPTGACSYQLSSTTLDVAGSASTPSLTVTAGSTCGWSASSNSSWITISSGASGSGNGSVTLSIDANLSAASRTGTVTVAGQTVTITQAATSCTTALSPSSQSIGANGAIATVSVSTACTWSAASNANWITITSGSAGTGNGTVTYSVAANTSGSTRTGTLSIGGQTLTVTQSGSSGGISTGLLSDPGFEARPAVWTEASSGGYAIINSSGSTSNKAPVTPHSGSYFAYLGGYDAGSDTLTSPGLTLPASSQSATLQFWYWISTNDDPSQAWDTLEIALHDAATGAKLATLATYSNLDANSGWAQSPAYDVSAYLGRTVEVRLTATTDTYYPTRFFIDDLQITAESGCPSALSPSAAYFQAASGSRTLAVTAASSCYWNAVSDATWLTVSAGGSGSSNGTVTYALAANTGLDSRSAHLTLGGQTLTVTQYGTGAAQYLPQVQTMYIAYFGRPADPEGLAYYSNLMYTQGGSYAALLDDFWNSTESKGLYTQTVTRDKIDQVYRFLFGRTGDSGGLDYWSNLVASGQTTLPSVAYVIAFNAGASDALILGAKRDAADAFSAALGTSAQIQSYAGCTSSGRNWLNSVLDAASSGSAVGGLGSTVAGLAPCP